MKHLRVKVRFYSQKQRNQRSDFGGGATPENGAARLSCLRALSILRAANDGNRAAVLWSRHVTLYAKLHSADFAPSRRSRCRAFSIAVTVREPR
jgi:hypothetical protein